MKPLSQHQLEVLMWLEDKPLSKTREVADGLGLEHNAALRRLETLYCHGLVARQGNLYGSQGWRWQSARTQAVR